jgi:hypothetical protein
MFPSSINYQPLTSSTVALISSSSNFFSIRFHASGQLPSSHFKLRINCAA